MDVWPTIVDRIIDEDNLSQNLCFLKKTFIILQVDFLVLEKS